MNTNTKQAEEDLLLPWAISPDGEHILGRETPDELPVIAKFYGAAVEDQVGAQALRYAVESVNSHAKLTAENERLREALQTMLESFVSHFPHGREVQMARAALNQ